MECEDFYPFVYNWDDYIDEWENKNCPSSEEDCDGAYKVEVNSTSSWTSVYELPVGGGTGYLDDGNPDDE